MQGYILSFIPDPASVLLGLALGFVMGAVFVILVRLLKTLL